MLVLISVASDGRDREKQVVEAMASMVMPPSTCHVAESTVVEASLDTVWGLVRAMRFAWLPGVQTRVLKV